MNKIYSGRRDKTGRCHVWVIEGGESRQLAPRLDLYNHSPDGFEWGYTGSGPAQLALAILADATGNDDLAVVLHQQFKFTHIAGLRRSQMWTMSQKTVLNFVSGHPPTRERDKA
jgi:Family of unknown function (DUF6166)